MKEKNVPETVLPLSLEPEHVQEHMILKHIT